MEEFVFRFPVVGRHIINKLDNLSITKAKQVSKSFSTYLDKDRSFWTRLLQMYSENHVIFKKDWILVTQTLPVEELKIFAFAVEKFYAPYTQQTKFQYSPLHIVAECGKTGLIHFNRNDGLTPFHFASDKGHFDICKLIIDNVNDKNPSQNDGETPLHNAANGGHFEICKLIIDN